MDLMSTLSGSLMESFFPAGWDLAKLDACVADDPTTITERQDWWHDDFELLPCQTLPDTMLGHEIAVTIAEARKQGHQLAMILPVGPMGMYRWAVYFLKEWGISCDHVHGFNMDEWSDADGNTLPSGHPGAFETAMASAFYGPLGDLTVPVDQRHFASKEALPHFANQIGEIRAAGGKLAVLFGIGRVCHIAFWEPQFAGEYDSTDDWKAATHRLGAQLHPLTIEQNAVTSFKSRTRPVPGCRQDHRWRRRDVFSRNDVAGSEPVDDPATRPHALDPLDLHAHTTRPTLLPRRTRRTARTRVQLVGEEG